MLTHLPFSLRLNVAALAVLFGSICGGALAQSQSPIRLVTSSLHRSDFLT